jgi:hypothetical protein
MFSILRLPAFYLFLFLLLLLKSPQAQAGVAVLANIADAPVRFTITGADGKQRQYELNRTHVIPIPVEDKISITYESEGKPTQYFLAANMIFYFVSVGKSLELQTFPIPPPPDEREDLAPPKARNIARTTITIPVKILTDDDQPTLQKIWEKELRERVAAASEIFELHCGVRFEVVAVDTWVSDNKISVFEKSISEFESKVNPEPAQVAIGFTSQYAIPRSLTHLGATRGPLHPYILIREWSQYVTKSERLEVLVHEMGHYLGAAHSGDPGSVMRPKLGDRQSHLASFRIGFDPLNTLAINLVSDELRARAYHGFPFMPLDTRRELQRIYLLLGKQVPKDPAADQYIEMLHIPKMVTVSSQAPKTSPLGSSTQAVVKAVVNAAKVNSLSSAELKGDAMTEYLISRAAAEAANQPPELAKYAFLYGIGIALDDSNLWNDFPVLGNLFREVESDHDRQYRLSIMGQSTMFGRHDLAQHFVVSCALAVRLGLNAAEQAGVLKEISDAHGKSGFSFIDLSADMAGVAFAEKIRDGSISLNQLADSFKTRDFMPDIKDLKEGISWEDFTKDYGSLNDIRYKKVHDEIQLRIKSLPAYKK